MFASGAYSDLRAVYEVGIGTEVKAYARGFARFFTASGQAGGASIGATWRRGRGLVRADSYFDGGYGGRKLGVDASARLAVKRTFELEGRLTGYQWRADLATDGAGATNAGGVVFGAQAGGRWLLGQGVRLHLLAEDNVGTYYRSAVPRPGRGRGGREPMMTRGRRTSAIAAVLLAVAAGAALAAGTDAPSPLIYPAETIPLAFDHAQHARLGATCESCHQTAQTSTSAADNLIPREAACRACHKIDRTQPTKSVAKGQGAARCDACHVGWTGIVEPSAKLAVMPPAEPPRVVLARPNLKFNHKLHAMRGIGCALCHMNADDAAGAGDARRSPDDGELPGLSRRQAGDRALLGLPPDRAGRAAEDEARQRGDDGGRGDGPAGAVRLLARRHRRAHGDVQARAQAGGAGGEATA